MAVKHDAKPATAHTEDFARLVEPPPCLAEIIDIRLDKAEASMLSNIKTGLRPTPGFRRSLPTLLLYDANGLRLFEKITHLQEYYLTNQEIQVLQTYADDIAQKVQNGTVLVELGSGNLRKIEILLSALERAKKNVEYYALDVSQSELQRTLGALPADKFHHVKFYGLYGTYEDGLKWLTSDKCANRPKWIISMGSSLGNFTKEEATRFLGTFSTVLRPGDGILVGLDGCEDPRKVFHAYNDCEGTTHEFILNGLLHANRLLDEPAFDTQNWRVIGEYHFDEQGGRHIAFVSPTQDVVVDGVKIAKDEKIQIEESNKFTSQEVRRLIVDAGLIQGPKWANQTGDYALHLAYGPNIEFSSVACEYASSPVPSRSDWLQLWTAWDVVTTQMIPKDELLSKPINLRNAIVFYLGHIPTFLDIHISRATGIGSPRLEEYQKIFERGIDPDVDNPELCHEHSEIPETWPPLDDILQYQRSVREKLLSILDSDFANIDRVRTSIWLGFEHEAMHLETLLYMLVQSDRMRPPRGVETPDFVHLSIKARKDSVPNEWVTIPKRLLKLGLDTSGKDGPSYGHFGWDNEMPHREVEVPSFQAKSQAITNRDLAKYLVASGAPWIPALWVCSVNNSHNAVTDDFEKFVAGKSVRTVFGRVPLALALEWPATASYDEISACAKWMGGRIPTEAEARSIYRYSEEIQHLKCADRVEAIPAVNSHLVNEGVEETPPPSSRQSCSSSEVDIDRVDKQLFIDLQDRNVGFKAWHPMSVTGNSALAGQSNMGGVWEWTSTVLARQKGFKAMEQYPGYTADFFDGKHNIVLGGSWATHPRIAGRKTFVNWYQRNYPYVWAGGRVVRDF